MVRGVVLLVVCGLFLSCTTAEWRFSWPPGKEYAVCLTYDDALMSQLRHAGPSLNQYHLKGTFFLSGEEQTLLANREFWKALADSGHELANHTIFHPCRKSLPGREWVQPDRDLDHYSHKELSKEIKQSSKILGQIDGKKDRTFAYPCFDTETDNGTYIPQVMELTTAARGGGDLVKTMKDFPIYDAPSWGPNDPTGEELIRYAEKAKENGTIAIFTFHNIGGGFLNTSVEAHDQLLSRLSQDDACWVTTFQEAMRYVKEHNGL